MKKRECGDCHACCVTVPVVSLNKPANVPCPHLQACTGGCCGVYAERPSECAVYECSWYKGEVPANWRPDQCGILFEASRIEWPARYTLLLGWELEAGAIERNRRYLRTMFPQGTVVEIVRHVTEETEKFGAAGDWQEVDAFFTMCKVNGGLTLRMADRDVHVGV